MIGFTVGHPTMWLSIDNRRQELQDNTSVDMYSNDGRAGIDSIFVLTCWLCDEDLVACPSGLVSVILQNKNCATEASA